MSKKFKVFIGFLVTITVVIIAVLVLPFVIDLNRFKPQIKNIVASQMNADLDFSSIRLTILSGLGFKLENVSLINKDPHFLDTKVLQVKEIHFKTELFPLFSKKIIGNIEIDSPVIKILKQGENNNLASLIKEKTPKENAVTQPSHEEKSSQSSQEGVVTQPSQEEPPKSKEAIPVESAKNENGVKANEELPAQNNDFIKNILIESFIIKDADISYYDLLERKGAVLVKDLNLNVSHIGLDQEMVIVFSTNLDVKETDYSINGPLSLKITAKTLFDAAHWKKSVFKSEFNLDNLNINYKNAFVKSNKVPFHLAFRGEATNETLLLNDFALKLQSLETQAKINIQNFNTLKSAIVFTLYSKDISSLADILPQHKSLLTKGDFTLSSNIQGNLKDMSSINSTTKLAANLYNSDIQLFFDENSITPLKGQLRVQARELNLNAILKPFMLSSAKPVGGVVNSSPVQANEKSSNSPGVIVAQSEKTAPLKTGNSQAINSQATNSQTTNSRAASPVIAQEFALDEKQKQLLKDANFILNLDINHLMYENIELRNLLVNSSLRNYILDVEKLGFNAFKGSMLANFTTNLNQTPLNYIGNMKFKNIEIQDLIKLVQLKEKSPLEGEADLGFNFNGRGTTRDVISKSLNVKGNYAFYSGRLNMKSIMALASEQLKKYTANMNIPGLSMGVEKLNSIDLGQNKEKDLKNVKGDFEIKNGKIIVDNNITSDQGDLKLNALIGLDESLSGKAFYTASPAVNSQLVALNKNFAYLFDSKGHLQLNLTLSGTLENPDVGIDPKNLTDNVMHNTTQALKNQIKDQIKEQIKNNPEAKKIEESAKKLLKEKGLDLGKFGF